MATHGEALTLAGQVETASALDGALARSVQDCLRAVFPAQAQAGQIPDGIAGSSDLIEALVTAALPGWHFSIHGRARAHGPWTCTLRRSGADDADEVLGSGEAPHLSQALLAALLRVAAYRQAGPFPSGPARV